ncbi:MAG: hypothetical protein IAF08_01325 [Rhizobacter sp.]|nr:hypothetical protein [Chlorobiales bacterium]
MMFFLFVNLEIISALWRSSKIAGRFNFQSAFLTMQRYSFNVNGSINAFPVTHYLTVSLAKLCKGLAAGENAIFESKMQAGVASKVVGF